MLSIRRIALTAAAAAALAAPAAQATPVDRPPSHHGFEWSDAAPGGGAGTALGFVLLVGGVALTALSDDPAASGRTRLRPSA
jgi:hypothetical protein